MADMSPRIYKIPALNFSLYSRNPNTWLLRRSTRIVDRIDNVFHATLQPEDRLDLIFKNTSHNGHPVMQRISGAAVLTALKQHSFSHPAPADWRLRHRYPDIHYREESTVKNLSPTLKEVMETPITDLYPPMPFHDAGHPALQYSRKDGPPPFPLQQEDRMFRTVHKPPVVTVHAEDIDVRVMELHARKMLTAAQERALAETLGTPKLVRHPAKAAELAMEYQGSPEKLAEIEMQPIPAIPVPKVAADAAGAQTGRWKREQPETVMGALNIEVIPKAGPGTAARGKLTHGADWPTFPYGGAYEATAPELDRMADQLREAARQVRLANQPPVRRIGEY